MSDPGDSASFGSWDDGIPLYADDVVQRWWGILAGEKPWADMVRDDAFGEMRRVLRELLNQARDPDQESRRYMVAAAREHGSFRRAQRCRREDLICEFGLVLDALDASLKRSGMPSSLIRDSLSVLDYDIALAQEAAANGWSHAVPARSIETDRWFDRLLGGRD